jgi:hypothetical protein
MMRGKALSSTAALLLFVVFGMLPNPARAQEQGTTSTAPGFVRVAVGECPFTADFRGPPFTASGTDDEMATKYAIYENARVKEVFLCGCDDTINAENMTQSDADAISLSFVRKKGGDLATISSEFLPDGDFGRELKYEGRFPKSIQGAIRLSARMIFVGRCLSAFVTSMYERDDQLEAARFLSSIARRQEGDPEATSGPATNGPATTSKPSSGMDASARLKQLEDAYRHNLVTPSEYQEKRKAILDAM